MIDKYNFTWMCPYSESPGATLAVLVRDGRMIARVVVSTEPPVVGFRFRACEWQLFDGVLPVRRGISDGLPGAVKAVEMELLAWLRLTDQQRETARENATKTLTI